MWKICICFLSVIILTQKNNVYVSIFLVSILRQDNKSIYLAGKTWRSKVFEGGKDIYCTMKTLRHCFIVGHVHDELIIKCDPRVDLNIVCEQMGRSPDRMSDILLHADGYEIDFYKKD